MTYKGFKLKVHKNKQTGHILYSVHDAYGNLVAAGNGLGHLKAYVDALEAL